MARLASASAPKLRVVWWRQVEGASMSWLKKFNNPFVLGLNGFLAGAVLFFATHPGTAESIAKTGSDRQAAHPAHPIHGA